MAEETFQMELAQESGYRFVVHFDDPGVPPLVTDELAPLGTGSGPNPIRLLGVAVANCLCASLLFSLRKYRNEPEHLSAVVKVTTGRNEHGRLRVASIAVDIRLGQPWAELKHADRALAQFEDFCTVTESVRAGIAVQVRVVDRDGLDLS